MYIRIVIYTYAKIYKISHITKEFVFILRKKIIATFLKKTSFGLLPKHILIMRNMLSL